VAEVVSEKGVEGATMRKIAQRARVSTGMLTYYFENKRDLITATLLEAASHFQERADKMAGPRPDLKHIEATFAILFPERDEATPPWSFWLEFWAQATRDSELRRYQASRFLLGRESNRRNFEASMRKGDLRKDVDASVLGELIMALYYGLGVAVTLAPEHLQPQRAYDLMQTFFSLLRQSKSSEPPAHLSRESPS
jgi:TetR/AcrR family transcriptional regulator, transcriptional repressor of bet genes